MTAVIVILLVLKFLNTPFLFTPWKSLHNEAFTRLKAFHSLKQHENSVIWYFIKKVLSASYQVAIIVLVFGDHSESVFQGVRETKWFERKEE